ncbi:MAG: DUF2071 domain-containing protein [Acidobacteriia bacterium]|nr:DUF2071 domain-containing protein [Terriglobia bacterium]
MFQRWRRLTFLHWRYAAEAIRPLIPRGLELDTFDGAAWVALTPFLVTGLRPPGAPALPWISQFPETNVRTYVRGPDGEGGVWFFTLEADRLASVAGARLLYRLPYRWADMRVLRKGRIVEYESARKWPFGEGGTSIAIHAGEPITANEFENFLTARFRLYTMWGERVAFAQIEHAPWPLHTARILRLRQNLIERSGVPAATGAPIVHYSPDLQVRIGRIQLCG